MKVIKRINPKERSRTIGNKLTGPKQLRDDLVGHLGRQATIGVINGEESHIARGFRSAIIFQSGNVSQQH